MLYINFRLYVLNYFKFKIKIIKYIHEFSLNEYIKKLSIYNKVSYYYY